MWEARAAVLVWISCSVAFSEAPLARTAPNDILKVPDTPREAINAGDHQHRPFAGNRARFSAAIAGAAPLRARTPPVVRWLPLRWLLLRRHPRQPENWGYPLLLVCRALGPIAIS
jgi:hypothetical protein